MGVNAASFGLSADKSQRADPTAVRIAHTKGLDIFMHRACTLSQFRLGRGDLLVAMEAWQARALLSVSSESGAQITLLGLWVNGPHPHIEDPYGLSEGYYLSCFYLIDASIEQIVQMIHQVRRKP